MRISNNQYENYEYINFATVATIENYFWTALTNYNSLCKIDRNSYEMEEIAVFKGSLIDMELYTRAIIHANKKLFFIPGRAANIAIYDMNTKLLRYLYIKDERECSGCKFGAAFLFNRYLYLFPQFLPCNNIYKIDVVNETIEYLSFDLKCIDGETEIMGNFVFGEIYDNHAWISLGNYPGFAKFDFYTEKLEIIKLNSDCCTIRDICLFRNQVFLLDENSNVIKYDLKECTEKQILNNQDINESYSRILYKNQKLWLLPMTANKIAKIKISDFNISFIDLPEECVEYLRWSKRRGKVTDYWIDKNKLYLWPFCLDRMIIIDLEKEKISSRKILTSKEKIKELKKTYVKMFFAEDKSICQENLNSIINYINVLKDTENNLSSDYIKNVGENIYLKLKNKMFLDGYLDEKSRNSNIKL